MSQKQAPMIKNEDVLFMVESLSNQRNLDKEIIFQAIEAALAAVTAKRYQEHEDEEDTVNIRVAINRDTGNYETFRVWVVVAQETDIEFPNKEISLSRAREIDGGLEIGDVIEEPVESATFGRIAASQARQVIIQKVREAERAKVIEQFRSRIGEMLTGVVKKVTRDHIVMDMGDSIEALLLREEMIPRETLRLNDRVRVYLYDVRSDKRGPQLLVSRAHPDLLVQLFKIEVPEIGEEVIEVKAAARDPGSRAKIAVKTNDGRIDPIGACVGMRGSRVQAVSNELAGERVDIVLWDDNPAQLVINAMAPAEVISIVVDEERKSMDLAVSETQLSQAIGRNGQNIRLASKLTGWTLNVMSEDEASAKQQLEIDRIKAMYMEKLAVDEDLATALARAGFTTLDEVAYVPVVEMLNIEGLDEDMVAELQNRAKDVLLMQKMVEGVAAERLSPTDDLHSVEGMTDELAENLQAQGITNREELAEQSVDELIEQVNIDPQFAAELIMRARAHWFEEEADAAQNDATRKNLGSADSGENPENA